MGWYPTAQDGNNDGSEIAEVTLGLDGEFGREKKITEEIEYWIWQVELLLSIGKFFNGELSNGLIAQVVWGWHPMGGYKKKNWKIIRR